MTNMLYFSVTTGRSRQQSDRNSLRKGEQNMTEIASHLSVESRGLPPVVIMASFLSLRSHPPFMLTPDSEINDKK